MAWSWTSKVSFSTGTVVINFYCWYIGAVTTFTSSEAPLFRHPIAICLISVVWRLFSFNSEIRFYVKWKISKLEINVKVHLR